MRTLLTLVLVRSYTLFVGVVLRPMNHPMNHLTNHPTNHPMNPSTPSRWPVQQSEPFEDQVRVDVPLKISLRVAMPKAGSWKVLRPLRLNISSCCEMCRHDGTLCITCLIDFARCA